MTLVPRKRHKIDQWMWLSVNSASVAPLFNTIGWAFFLRSSKFTFFEKPQPQRLCRLHSSRNQICRPLTSRLPILASTDHSGPRATHPTNNYLTDSRLALDSLTSRNGNFARLLMALRPYKSVISLRISPTCPSAVSSHIAIQAVGPESLAV